MSVSLVRGLTTPFQKAGRLTAPSSRFGVNSRPLKRSIRGFGTFKAPPVRNEPNPSYSKGSIERQKLQDAISRLKSSLPVRVPSLAPGITNAKSVLAKQYLPSDHSVALAEYAQTTPEQVSIAIDRALEAKPAWENTSFKDRAAVFLRAAELIAGKYRYDIMAATMLGQGKNIWQAEIDSAAESCDFLRFNVHYAAQLYDQQNALTDAGIMNRTEYRPLEGFVYAISPFNFTAIGANLTVAPAIMGNVVLWKPSDYAIYSSYLLQKVFEEAGLPAGVIQFLPGEPEAITSAVLDHSQFAALHFTGSTDVFRQLYGMIGDGVASGKYESYPRMIGETGGKNFHLVHGSADVRNAVVNTVRGAFEYQGQKCSATSRLYVAESIWPEFKEMLLRETNNLKVGSPEQVDNFIGPVIHERSWTKLRDVIEDAKKDPAVELLAGGHTDNSQGWFVSPTIFQTNNAQHKLMRNELFGPILAVHVYPDAKYEEMLPVIDSTTQYGLTGAVFARDRGAIEAAEKGLRHAAGNFYVNSKSSGAVVGHQPFGGGRASGTNDKATSVNLLTRFTSMRSMKEDLVGADTVLYPSNEA
ncbi:delta-1-pyrroline-5-carboxylate dehydrogenase [Colletotrichum scovillei]|uniref:Multifunctional fusion protein n=1 Tax=Colletotrichum scovillei TaxID=1209932 RepID=A0A9P7RIY8_9PEZI|nr:delta-1-pyrroline-5-carboxylate dehydrogenase [Colletotrichum scovillei]KAF4780239.1 delta-1-pyrroline-5-carboxylate dehydrogenase [Colletotrichum scovillei]KAG7057782.1 delta-1-pyrroline-5-carboxylate dehydrogenase [Colletotrichum scovillei]KAG7076379.1 delta-1-pyrroline-5-carboxylate dehydrogenase [Colletotrichum scovillei]KAG7083490.1 delta-1-pyrroline-5-carboxylate dehydrogenase [Colletotrichum scovillei]